MTRLQRCWFRCRVAKRSRKRNKALVHKESTTFGSDIISDVSKITVFQSLSPFTQKSNDECFKIAKKNNSYRSKSKHRIRDFLSFHQMWGKRILFFGSRSTCCSKFLTLQDGSFICTGGSNHASIFWVYECPFPEL